MTRLRPVRGDHAVDRAENRSGRWRWAALPGILAAVLPKAACPICVTAYAAVVSALGLGFLLTDRVLNPIILGSLAVSVGSAAWSGRQRRRSGPVLLSLAGAAGVVLGRMVWSLPAVVYGGVALLLGASVWTLWLSRPASASLVQISLIENKGGER